MGSICTRSQSVEVLPSPSSESLKPSVTGLRLSKGPAEPTSASVVDDLSESMKGRDSHRVQRDTQLKFLDPDPEVPSSEAARGPVPGSVNGEADLAFAASPRTGSWQLQKVIGRGSFGEVYLATNRAGELAAVKVLAFQAQAANFPRRLQLLERELGVLRNLPPHPNVIRYLTARCRGSRVFIFMDYCDGGTLRDLYLRRRSGLTLGEGQMYATSIVQGLRHLHSHHIAHRDVKCENVFLTKRGDIKLGDFGASVPLEDAARSSFIGSVHWMAPEVVTRQGHKLEADIWSLGCAVMELFTGTHPFAHYPAIKGVIAFLESNDPIALDPAIPKLASDFILTCLKRNPEDRPTCCELLRHDFLTTDLDCPLFRLSFQSAVNPGSFSAALLPSHLGVNDPDSSIPALAR